MAYRFLVIIVTTVLIIQLCRGRYCQEAVNSVQIVESCPTLETEWAAAARKKNCSRIAMQQDCSLVELFQYHCVVNGYRNETLEVCAPRRIIFGHCVEFNVPGGVIQDQLSTPCNNIFPKCDGIYESVTAYKYPDCYQLVYNNKSVSITTTIESIPNAEPIPNAESSWDVLMIFTAAVIFTMVIISICLFRRPAFFARKMAFIVKTSHQSNESKMRERRLLQTFEEQNNMFNPELPTRNTSPAPSSIQSVSSGSTIYEVASGASGDNPNVLQPKSGQIKDASDNQSEDLSTVQSDSDNICDPQLPIRNISPVSSSIQSASSGSTIFEDASEGRSDDPDDLQPNSDDTQETHHL